MSSDGSEKLADGIHHSVERRRVSDRPDIENDDENQDRSEDVSEPIDGACSSSSGSSDKAASTSTQRALAEYSVEKYKQFAPLVFCYQKPESLHELGRQTF